MNYSPMRCLAQDTKVSRDRRSDYWRAGLFLRAGLLALLWAVQAAGIVAADPLPIAQSPAVNADFGFADVKRRAAQLAVQRYQPDRPPLPEFLSKLSYDAYRAIRFKPAQALWRGEGLPFEAQFFLRGFIYAERVSIHVLDRGRPAAFPYRNDLFDFGSNAVPGGAAADLGFAGFRLHYPLNRADYYDEVAVFLGASYFRFLGQQQHYGLSARGLAIDTGASSGEEFPAFREFWLQKPEKGATEMTVYALLDSPRVAGAYRFVIKPGAQTQIDVKAHLYFRGRVEKLGIAPLTSMFLHGKTTERYANDFRPEVHDSDGLLIESGNGERIWRPLVNPAKLRISSYQLPGVRGFGLFQRERRFSQYEDLEANYQSRPSVWIEPLGDWGKGVVELVEIPGPAERHDNIVAYWVPARALIAGQELELDYRLQSSLTAQDQYAGGRAIATRIGAGNAGRQEPSARKFVIDFVGPWLKDLAQDAPIEVVLSATHAQLGPAVAQRNPETGGRRIFFEMHSESDKPVELRCFLRHAQKVLTETWSYQWTRE